MKLGMTLAVAVCLAPEAFGQQMSVDFDPAATKINWTLVGNVHTTHGTFQLKQGHVDVAEGRISGELVVAADSGDSGNSTRDKRMKTEILESGKFPDIRFKVTKLEGVEPNFRVVGQFTIHGASHELSIPMQMKINGSEVSGTGKFVAPFVDWGMKDPSNFLFKVNKTVEVELIAEGHIKR
jgi:polyisoprenoid-binding protein YceI